MRKFGFKCHLLMCVWIVMASACFLARADVSSLGDISPVPDPTGGSITGTLTIGIGDFSGEVLVGSMRVSGGTTLSDTDGIVGQRFGAIGVVAVDGSGSLWTHTDDLTVGDDGIGELQITSSGRVNVRDDMFIGNLDDGQGVVGVHGTTTVLDVESDMSLGNSGAGMMSVDDAGKVFTRNVFIGNLTNSSGYAVVEGTGSSWVNRGNLVIGARGIGTLAIRDAARLESLTTSMGTFATGNGNVIVEGGGTVLEARTNLVIGTAGSGALAINDAGLVTVVSGVQVGPRGKISLDNGRLSAASIDIAGVLGGSGQVSGTVINAGEIHVAKDGSLFFTGQVKNAGRIESRKGQVTFDATVSNSEDGQIALRDSVVRFRDGMTNQGTLAISTGATDVFGDVTNTGTVVVAGDGIATFYDDLNNDGRLVVEPGSQAVFIQDLVQTANAAIAASIDLAAEDDWQPLTVAATAALDGSLEIAAISLNNPADELTERGDSQTFSVLVAGALSGVFGTVEYNGQQLSPTFLEDDGRSFRSHVGEGLFRFVTYFDTSVEITNHLALLGDSNGDRSVDFVDFLALSSAFGQLGDWTNGDFDASGDVAFPDFLVLSSAFGSSVDASMATAAVPEPSTALLLLFAMGAIISTQRRNRCQ